jgi:hypothetical protein
MRKLSEKDQELLGFILEEFDRYRDKDGRIAFNLFTALGSTGLRRLLEAPVNVLPEDTRNKSIVDKIENYNTIIEKRKTKYYHTNPLKKYTARLHCLGIMCLGGLPQRIKMGDALCVLRNEEWPEFEENDPVIVGQMSSTIVQPDSLIIETHVDARTWKEALSVARERLYAVHGLLELLCADTMSVFRSANNWLSYAVCPKINKIILEPINEKPIAIRLEFPPPQVMGSNDRFPYTMQMARAVNSYSSHIDKMPLELQRRCQRALCMYSSAYNTPFENDIVVRLWQVIEYAMDVAGVRTKADKIIKSASRVSFESRLQKLIVYLLEIQYSSRNGAYHRGSPIDMTEEDVSVYRLVAKGVVKNIILKASYFGSVTQLRDYLYFVQHSENLQEFLEKCSECLADRDCRDDNAEKATIFIKSVDL